MKKKKPREPKELSEGLISTEITWEKLTVRQAKGLVRLLEKFIAWREGK